ncbi:MAG: hypothetical protein A2167_00430 [Planctomycetes bacterium RBG_13_46_10]|nr:MAG: hypothetical protein A2167_00430 [Planctomycetes bacterium RBG_13_46_10]
MSSQSRQYSHTQELINNLPYIAMIMLGMAVLFLSINTLLWKWLTAVAYLIYGVAGVFWIILFLCPFCRYYDTNFCPCGYGQIAGKLRSRKLQNRESSQDCFNEKFKKHIPVIVPLWFIPVLVGVTVEFHTFSIGLLALLIVFAVDAFVLLPLFSTKHSCKECPQRDSCPWMKQRRTRGE